MEGKAAVVSLLKPLSPGPVFPFNQDTLGKLGLMNPRLLFHINLPAPRDTDTIYSSNSSILVREAVWLKPRVPTPLPVKLFPDFPPCDICHQTSSSFFLHRVQAVSLLLLPVRYFSEP